MKVLSWSHTERRTRIDKPLELIVFGGFLTIVIGLSVTLLAIVLVNTVGVGPTWLPVVALLGIVVSLYLYYVGLETVFREFE